MLFNLHCHCCCELTAAKHQFILYKWIIIWWNHSHTSFPILTTFQADNLRLQSLLSPMGRFDCLCLFLTSFRLSDFFCDFDIRNFPVLLRFILLFDLSRVLTCSGGLWLTSLVGMLYFLRAAEVWLGRVLVDLLGIVVWHGRHPLVAFVSTRHKLKIIFVLIVRFHKLWLIHDPPYFFFKQAMGMWGMISNTAMHSTGIILASLLDLESISRLLFKLLKLTIILVATQDTGVVIRCELNDLDWASFLEVLFCYFLLNQEWPFLLFDVLL